MAARFLTSQKLDDDPWLPTAAGAAIEVHAQVLAARGERAEAVDYLAGQLKQFAGTSLPERISKNINLLSLEGKPAPELDLSTSQWLGAKPPTLASLRGRPVLLFFWAHWCSDCKAEVAVLADIRKTFAAQAPGGRRTHSPLWLCGRRRGRSARQGETVHRGGPPPFYAALTRHAGAYSAPPTLSPMAPVLHPLWC